MKIITITTQLSDKEREIHCSLDTIDRMWIVDTTILKFYRKLQKQGWVQTKKYVYEDGTVCGGEFTASERAITFRNIVQKLLTDKQKNNLK